MIWLVGSVALSDVNDVFSEIKSPLSTAVFLQTF